MKVLVSTFPLWYKFEERENTQYALLMDRTDAILKRVAEAVLEEEGTFFVTLNVDTLDLPLEGTQRLVFGGNATPDLIITDGGVSASLAINRIHYDIYVPWRLMTAVEGAGKAFYCRRKRSVDDDGTDENSLSDKKKSAHLRVVK